MKTNTENPSNGAVNAPLNPKEYVAWAKSVLAGGKVSTGIRREINANVAAFRHAKLISAEEAAPFLK